MGANFSKLVTVADGQTITAAERNAEIDNILSNFTPTGMDDHSTNATQMQSTTDPYPGATESLPTSLAGELERIRYLIKQITGETQWYVDPNTDITVLSGLDAYRRPRLSYVSATAVDVENNTSTEHETKIIFPDGTTRSVTENTGSATKYRRFIITETAEYTTGTENSGLYTGLSEETNRTYYIYAVKSAIDSTKFVLVGNKTAPTRANIATLNSALGSNGYVYLGAIKNGDNSGATGDILSFTQSGKRTLFRNTCAGNSANLTGVRLATTAGATSLTHSYVAGTGATDIPETVEHVILSGAVSGGTGVSEFRDAGDAVAYAVGIGTVDFVAQAHASASLGAILKNSSSVDMDIVLSGFDDAYLK